MKSMIGLRLMTLESIREKETTTALTYALAVIQLEVQNEWAYENVKGLGSGAHCVARDLIDYLTHKCDITYWSEVLKQMGLLNANKKQAELLLNAYSAAIVAPCILGVMEEGMKSTRSVFKRRRMGSIRKDVEFLYKDAADMLGKAHAPAPPSMLEGFKQYAYAGLQNFYASL